MSEFAEFLRGELKIIDDSKRLGIPRTIDHDKAVMVFRRAAEEIEEIEARHQRLLASSQTGETSG